MTRRTTLSLLPWLLALAANGAAAQEPNYCENGSHLAIFDDQKTYFDGLIRFIRDVDAKKF